MLWPKVLEGDLEFEWKNLKIDFKKINSDLENEISEIQAKILKQDFGLYEKTEELTESELKKLKKADLIQLVLDQNETLRIREDQFKSDMTDALETETENIFDYFLSIPEEINSLLDNFYDQFLKPHF